MKLCTIRHRLAKIGYILLTTQEGFTITDNGVKTPFGEHFPDLTAVEHWSSHIETLQQVKEHIAECFNTGKQL